MSFMLPDSGPGPCRPSRRRTCSPTATRPRGCRRRPRSRRRKWSAEPAQTTGAEWCRRTATVGTRSDNERMLLAPLVSTSQAVAGTRSRLAKRDALAGLLREATPADIPIVVAYLAGELRQRRTGVGWGSLRSLPPPADEPSLTLAEIDAEFE